jgi:hypothetical protein
VFRRPSTVYAEAKTVAGSGLSIPLSGGLAYTFEVCGKGSYRVAGGDSVYVSSSAFIEVRGKIDQASATGAVIAFEGDYTLSVRNAAVYADVMETIDIPAYKARTEYSVNEVDFIALDGKSIAADDMRLYGIEIIDNRRISVPFSTAGEIGVRYQRKVEEVTINTGDNEDIDIDPDLERLLPLLVASYAYLTDDTTAKAQYYRQLYESDRATVMREIRNLDPNNLIKTNGW